MTSLSTLAVLADSSAPQNALPHLRTQGRLTQLIVDGQPYLARAGELGNSSGEPAYLRGMWPRLQSLNLNTLLAPIYWELIEPEEGRFDFSTVDGLLADARAHDIRLVLLWFGSWKNSMSTYVPAWVKRNTERFPRARDRAGRALDILSAFSTENAQADARAFAALMRHLGQHNREHTVILVQVENEIGMIPNARDHSPAANQAYESTVPAPLIAHLHKHRESLAPELRTAWRSTGPQDSGTWRQVFGTGAMSEEVFMAWHFAYYTERVAAAGRAEYALPLYTNAALIRPGYQPGQYPSGGPLPHLFEIWRAAAPSLDFLAPDIYFQDFTRWARSYADRRQALFIPEVLRDSHAATKALYVVAELGAIGLSPFAIESLAEPSASVLSASYDLIRQLSPLITNAQVSGQIAGFYKESSETRQPQQIQLGNWVIHASFEHRAASSASTTAPETVVGADLTSDTSPTQQSPAGGLVIALGEDEFLFAGSGLTLTFSAAAGEDWQVGLLNAAEGQFSAEGDWQHRRWLNGDQTHQGRHLRLEPGSWSIQRVRLYRYR